MVLSGFANTSGKAKKFLKENWTCGLFHCLLLGFLKKTNNIFFLINFSSLHFEYGTPLTPKVDCKGTFSHSRTYGQFAVSCVSE